MYQFCIASVLHFLLIPTVSKWSEAQFNFCTAKPILCTCFNGYNKYAHQKFQNIRCVLLIHCFIVVLLGTMIKFYLCFVFEHYATSTPKYVCAFVEGWKQLETMEIFHSFALPLLHCYGTFRSLGGALRLWSLAIQLGRQHINKII